MKCPLCKKEAKEAYYRPGKYVCKCTGVLEDIDVLEKEYLQKQKEESNISSNNNYPVGGKAPEYKASMKIVVKKNKTNNSLNSAIVNVSYGNGLYNSTKSNLMNAFLDGGFLYSNVYNILYSNSNKTIDYLTEFCNLISNKNTLIINANKKSIKCNADIYHPTDLEDAYSKLENSYNNYDLIIPLDFDLLVPAKSTMNNFNNSVTKQRAHTHNLKVLVQNRRSIKSSIVFLSAKMDSPLPPMNNAKTHPSIELINRFSKENLYIAKSTDELIMRRIGSREDIRIGFKNNVINPVFDIKKALIFKNILTTSKNNHNLYIWNSKKSISYDNKQYNNGDEISGYNIRKMIKDNPVFFENIIKNE